MTGLDPTIFKMANDQPKVLKIQDLKRANDSSRVSDFSKVVRFRSLNVWRIKTHNLTESPNRILAAKASGNTGKAKFFYIKLI